MNAVAVSVTEGLWRIPTAPMDPVNSHAAAVRGFLHQPRRFRAGF